MKKLIALILALALLPIVALADLPDISGLSDQELKDLISACSQELMSRNPSEPEGILIFEYEGVKVYQTGEAKIDKNFLRIPVAVYNELEEDVIVSFQDVNCNGWDVWGGTCSASAKAKKKDDLSIKTADADVTEFDQIVSLKFKWQLNGKVSKVIYKQEEAEEHRFW